MPTVLIGPAHLRRATGAFRDLLQASGFTIIDPVGDPALNEAELRCYLPEADALLAGGEIIPRAMFALAPRLRVIARVGVGYDLIDIPAATDHRVAVTITPGANQESVAEQTFALLLAVARNVAGNDRTIKAGGWDRTLPRPLRGATLGLLGLGRIGRAVATRAIAFGMNVVAFDTIPPSDFEIRHGIGRLDFDELLAAADVVSIHLPLTETTRGLFREETIRRMRPGAILINTARGAHVVEDDLSECLKAGHLAGAGLDVLNQEPPDPGNPLLRLPNVVLSPHLGGIDTKGLADMATMAAQCIIDLHGGRWPSGCVVNTELKAAWRW
jgi:phosphoglycerate dehydrogenase-like enzyme